MIEKIKSYLSSSPSNISFVGPLAQDLPEFSKNEPIIFIDGGAVFKKDRGLSLGDNDSFEGELDYILPTKKDFSDLSFALSLVPENNKVLNLFGFLGGRKDHELINYGEIFRYLSQRKQSKVILDNSIYVFSQGNWELEIEGEFSIVSFNRQKISLEGKCEYPVKNTFMESHSSHGLSNLGFGKITLQNERPLFIFVNKVLG